ncbi:hypothetical protein DAEQUDRAFT_813973 [Daedalea quercina L-15889]|uniref:Uncharacterized protein n=1 Tax=Daedalea quercina L-15889 TaxID=1314783 RepID=A0A165MN03_9APHY|nr:hypothetical protein DAEQUDRAFT_813973 [Daedalea quercina L-15889]
MATLTTPLVSSYSSLAMALGPVDPALRPSTRENLPEDTALYAAPLVPEPAEPKDAGLKRAYDFDDGDSDLELGRYEKRTRLSPMDDGGRDSGYATGAEEELPQDEAADQESIWGDEPANENVDCGLDGTESLDMGWTEPEWMEFMAALFDLDAAGAPKEEASEQEAPEEEASEQEAPEEEASEQEAPEEESEGESSEQEASEQESEDQEAPEDELGEEELSGEESFEEESSEDNASIEESEGQMVHDDSTPATTEDPNQSAMHGIVITPEFNTLTNCRVAEWTDSVRDTLHNKITSAVYQSSWDQMLSICLSEYRLAEKHLGGCVDEHLGCTHLFPLKSRLFLSPSPTKISRPKTRTKGWLPYSDRPKREPSRLCQEITDDILHATGDASSSNEGDAIPVGASSAEVLSTVHDPELKGDKEF